uniref:Uncharacterized protein n=1 Tax=Davidia involucrata TaxID=16924 RepID=A0A5B7BQZ7_DAVIN
MSQSEKERSDVVGGSGGGDDDGGGCSRSDDQKKEMDQVCEGHVRKGKRMALFRFRKVKKQLHRRKKRPSNPSSSATTGCLGKRFCGGGGGCYLCFRKPQTLDSPVESQTSDPNNPEFTCEMLKALIEKNDFYSKECNPHLDLDIDTDNLSSYTDVK